ncbi:MAG: hypothetical protein IT262_04600 [Saprospiraceae bacterium]|nr:hypothetical protein [Saprospiraceae bacterium]
MKTSASTFLFRLAWVTAFAVLTASHIHAQYKTETFNPRFEVFELPGGVLGNSVQGIVQDRAGFLWFASQEGLHRYDGQTFFTYRNDPLNANSLTSDYIEYIFLDSKGVLWLAHWNAGGLTAFDPATETFTRYSHDPGNPETLSGNTNSIIAEDRDGNIWVGGQAGLDRFDRKTGKFKRFHHDPDNPRSLSYNHVRGLYVDKKGTLWVGTGFTWDNNDTQQKLGGLNRYDPKTETFTRYLHELNSPSSISHNHVRAILEDRRGNFWVGTGGDGLHLMDREKGTFTRLEYDPANPTKLSRPWLRDMPIAAQPLDSHISSIFEDKDGRIWITAIMGGLNVYDPATGIVRHFETESGEGNLSTSFLWHTFQSADGVIWITTGNGGGTVFKVKKDGKRFPFFAPDSSNPSNVVSEVVKDKTGNIWIGYYNNSIYPLICFDRKTGNTIGMNPGTEEGGLNARQVNALLVGREGYLWVGTDQGLFRLDPQTGIFQHFPNPVAQSPWVGNLLQDRNGNIWICSNWRQDGLDRFDPRTGKYIHYQPNPADPGSIGGSNATGLYEDAEGNLWVGGGSGNDLDYPFYIDRFNPGDEQVRFTHFIKEPVIGTAEDLVQDNQGNIWFLAYGGIEKFNPANGAIQKFNSTNSNLLSRNLTGMAKAKNGKIWINSNSGIVYVLDPETAQFHAFGKQYGVSIASEEVSEVQIADDGEVLIGRSGGFIAFYPDSLVSEINGRIPDVRVTDFRLLEERITPDGSSVLNKPIWQTTDLRLAYNQNVFSFSVACFDFHDPASNQLQFMLEGYDKGWRKDLRDGETPSYVNVPPGEYTFRVRGANSLGIWNMEGVGLRITITPPWWKTVWAYTFYGITLLAGLFFTNRILRKRIADKERAKSRERELAQAQEIEKAYHELKATQAQLIQSEKLASLGELTAGIAHEIQNPLNFVNNFSELSVELAQELLEEIEKPNLDKTAVHELVNDLTQNQQKINHHGKRAASIVTGMLQHSRASTGVKEPTDLNALADEYLRLSYHGLRAKESTFNAKMVTDFDPAVGKVEVIPQDIGRVLLNLINNAFYAVKQREQQLPESSRLSGSYVPKVTVSTQKTDNQIIIKIKDNGTGIPDSVKAKMFQPFFTTKPTGQGTGLGLSLAYDIVTKGHGGTLEVESKEGEGTIFVINLPY